MVTIKCVFFNNKADFHRTKMNDYLLQEFDKTMLRKFCVNEPLFWINKLYGVQFFHSSFKCFETTFVIGSNRFILVLALLNSKPPTSIVSVEDAFK